MFPPRGHNRRKGDFTGAIESDSLNLKNARKSTFQNQLGHSDPRLAFQLYVVSVPGERRAAVERLSLRFERLLDPNWTQGALG